MTELEPTPEPTEVESELLVLSEVTALEHPPTVNLPAIQAAVAAATGFLAGAATLALVRRLGVRRLARGQPSGPWRGAEALPVHGTRTFLVDVHLLAKPGE